MLDQLNFIIVDDNEVDVFIATKMIEAINPNITVRKYLMAEDALEMIRSCPTTSVKTVLLIDINMPLNNGFWFMDEFEKLPNIIKQNYIPCFLTSSINEGDISASKTYKSVFQYISKPLSSLRIKELIDSLLTHI